MFRETKVVQYTFATTVGADLEIVPHNRNRVSLIMGFSGPTSQGQFYFGPTQLANVGLGYTEGSIRIAFNLLNDGALVHGPWRVRVTAGGTPITVIECCR